MNQKNFLPSILIIVLLLLAGCAAPASTSNDTESDSNTTQENAADLSAFPVTITDDVGEVTLEQPAERIVVFSEEFIELFVAMDMAPVGVGLWRNESTGDVFAQLPYLDQPIPGEPRYINGSEPNLEVIAALQPDLIINHEYAESGTTELQEALAQIAPVLSYFGGEAGGWMRAIRGLGQATGYSDQAEAVIADYEARVAELQAEMEPIVAQAPEVALLLSTVDGIGVFDERFAIGGLMEVLGFGLSVPESVEMPDSGYTTMSVESLSEITADTIVQMRFSPDQEHVSDPILQSLDMPTLQTPIYPGMGYTGPFAEIIYLEGFAEVLGAQYGSETEATGDDSDNAVAASVAVLAETETERVIQHADGRETTIPADPQCVVTAGSGYLDHLLALGVTPCGAAHGPGGSGFPAHLVDQLTDVEYVGGTLEVNLESVVFLDPDLILAMHPEHTEGNAVTNFDPIAPTVYLTQPWANWRQTLREIGAILGKEAKAEAVLSGFDETTDAAAATLAESIGTEKVAFLRVQTERIRVYGMTGPTGDMLFHRLGLTPSGLVPIDEEQQTISLELIPELDADHLFLLDQTDDGMATLTGSPLWQTVPAVQNGNVYPVDVKIWIQGEGLFAYEQLVNDVVDALTAE